LFRFNLGFNGLAYLPIQPYKIYELLPSITEKEMFPHPINHEKFTANVLAGSAGKKNDWTSKVYRVAPTRSWDTLCYLAETCWISQ
jgi:hypothetical protein